MVDPRFSSSIADRYRIERELGAGGMATVYLAHDTKHDRKVALKVLHPELSLALGGKRFLQEIRTTANLHPHIVGLIDSGQERIPAGETGPGGDWLFCRWPSLAQIGSNLDLDLEGGLAQRRNSRIRGSPCKRTGWRCA
jgi:serine/threonine protein kinase